ncbi:MAG TPA: hypothetical protein VK818_23805 [Methylomirabilota bacterium]|jgi:hypothetical protein|nr:hypothetical protein [Methylomirabilota bacterium]
MVIDSWAQRKENAMNVTPVIDAIEGRGWRQEIRRELLCKLQQKLSSIAEAPARISNLFARVI